MLSAREEPSSHPLSDLTLTLVGPGRVGSSLAAWALAAGARIRRIGVRSGRPSDGLPADIPRLALTEVASAGDDLLLIAVADAALDAVAAELGRRPQARVALHVSGSRTAAALAPLRSAGSAIGSFHPLKAFPASTPDPAAAAGVFFGLDGDPAAVDLGRRLAAAFGGTAGVIPSESRLLYHFAATLAAGGVTTLLAAAADLSRRLGLPPEVVGGYLSLARGALEGAAGVGDPARGITGPAARGDRATLSAQLAALEGVAPEMAPWVRLLAAETLRQRARIEAPDTARRRLLEELEGTPGAGSSDS